MFCANTKTIPPNIEGMPISNIGVFFVENHTQNILRSLNGWLILGNIGNGYSYDYHNKDHSEGWLHLILCIISVLVGV